MEEWKTQSDDLTKLVPALVQAQSEMPSIGKNAENPFYKSAYADIASIIEVATPILTRNDLSVCHVGDMVDEKPVLITMLLHSSGQWIRGRMILNPTKDDPQNIGGAMTYQRRYGFMAIVGLATDDDDGNAISKKQPEKKTPQKPPSNLTPDQKKMLGDVYGYFKAISNEVHEEAMAKINSRLAVIGIKRIEKSTELSGADAEKLHASMADDPEFKTFCNVSEEH